MWVLKVNPPAPKVWNVFCSRSGSLFVRWLHCVFSHHYLCFYSWWQTLTLKLIQQCTIITGNVVKTLLQMVLQMVHNGMMFQVRHTVCQRCMNSVKADVIIWIKSNFKDDVKITKSDSYYFLSVSALWDFSIEFKHIWKLLKVMIQELVHWFSCNSCRWNARLQLCVWWLSGNNCWIDMLQIPHGFKTEKWMAQK